MPNKPQQNEIRRSERGSAGVGGTDALKAKADLDGGTTGDAGGGAHPVPPGNQPGWMQRDAKPAKKADDDERDQDKPDLG
jgi:hypothetical protein